MKITKHIFKKDDILQIGESCKNWSWYKPDNYRVVSYYLHYTELNPVTKVNEDRYIHESKIPEKDLTHHSISIGSWCINLRSLETGKYTKIAESFLEYSKIEMRNKKINELIEDETT